MNMDLSWDFKEAARRNGADLVGIVRLEDLPEHREEMDCILPEAKSVVVVAALHSLAALRSQKLQAACPSQALSGQGKINKKRCGDQIFKFRLRELWQTFMTGNYYYCFACQAQCPATQSPLLKKAESNALLSSRKNQTKG